MPPILKKKRFWIILASVLALAWVAETTFRAISIQKEDDKYRVLQEGDTMPEDMPFVSLDGKYTSFKEYKGKLVFINFWAAWCAPCLKEMPSIYALHERLKEKGLVVIGVAMDDDLGQGMATLSRIAGPAPIMMVKGPEQAISNRFPIEGLPFTVVIDRTGVIKFARPGERDWMDKDAIALLEGML